MNSPSPLLSIIVPTYNRSARAIESVRRLAAASATIHREIIVVDQTRPPPPRPRDFAELGVRMVLLEQANIARARNAGALAAKGSVLLFLDDDIVLHESYLVFLADMLSAIDENVISGEIVEGFGDVSKNVDLIPMTWVSTANIIMARDQFVKIGGFDENLYRFNEDAEFSHRALSSGLKIFKSPSLQVKHDHNPDGGVWRKGAVPEAAKALIYCDLYFARTIGASMYDRFWMVANRIRSEAYGNGRLRGGTRFSRLFFCLVAIPGALLYSYKTPNLIKTPA
nr:glycosyltransferase family A protein [Methylocystis echinoides]